jgi:hypothetical protein
MLSIYTKKKNIMAKGAKVERNSVSDQDHEIRYEANKLDVKPGKIKDTKASAGNQREAIEKKVK